MNETAENPPISGGSSRLASLDAFRGLTIFGMLLVNNIPLGKYSPKQLTHAAWNQGVNIADLVFPWFLFIVGVAIPFSAASHARKGIPRWRYNLKAFSRTFWLVILGLLLDSSIARQPVLGLGVLQLIGLSYLVGALVYPFRTWERLLLAGLLLFGHWGLIRFYDVPGTGAGVFTEQSNAISYINTRYLAQYHLKGLISVVPASAMVLLGTAAGDFIRSDELKQAQKGLYLMAAGIILTAAGLLWNLDLPFNKPVWTASYIVYTAGLAGIVLGAMYLAIDTNKFGWWAFPLVVFGSNAIMAYVIPILAKVYILQSWTLGSETLQQAFLGKLTSGYGQIQGGWLYTGIYIAFWWLVLLWMHRKKLYLRV